MSTPAKIRKADAPAILSHHGIFFNEPNDFPAGSIGIPHVDSLIGALIDFTSLLPKQFERELVNNRTLTKEEVEDEQSENEAVWYDPCCEHHQVGSIGHPKWSHIRKCRDALKHAKRLARHRKAHEPKWQIFYERHFFDALLEEVEGSCGFRRETRANHVYDSFVGVADTIWSKAGGIREIVEKECLPLTPKPDYAMFFPLSTLERDRADYLAGFMQENPDSYSPLFDEPESTNFSTHVLARLRNDGLIAHVAKDDLESLHPGEMYCFPWFIAEFKRATVSQTDARYCYCQAANCASVALAMYKNLAKFSENKHGQWHIPPIPVMTAIGPVVRIWVVYKGGDNRAYSCQMTPIWGGNMTNFWDVLKLKTIIENAHTWAMRTLRPRISIFIEQWRFRYEEQWSHARPTVEDEKDPLERSIKRILKKLFRNDDQNLTKNYKDSISDILREALRREVDLLEESTNTDPEDSSGLSREAKTFTVDDDEESQSQDDSSSSVDSEEGDDVEDPEDVESGDALSRHEQPVINLPVRSIQGPQKTVTPNGKSKDSFTVPTTPDTPPTKYYTPNSKSAGRAPDSTTPCRRKGSPDYTGRLKPIPKLRLPLQSDLDDEDVPKAFAVKVARGRKSVGEKPAKPKATRSRSANPTPGDANGQILVDDEHFEEIKDKGLAPTPEKRKRRSSTKS